MIDEIHALLSRHLPGHKVRSVAKLDEGLDNAAFEINGELIVRKSKEADPAVRAESTRREANLLAVLTGLSTLPVPKPIFADVEAGVLAYPKLPGLPLMDHPVADPARLAPALAGSSAACTGLPWRRWSRWSSGISIRFRRGERRPNTTTGRSRIRCP